MPTGTIILLGAFAGLTIYLGLPIAFLKQTPQSLKVFLNMLATGVLVFLLFDVVSKASDPINAALDQVRTHNTGAGTLFLDVLLFVLGIGLGSVGLVYFNRFAFGRLRIKSKSTPSPVAIAETEQVPRTSGPSGGSSTSVGVVAEKRLATGVKAMVEKAELSGTTLALLIATGIGLHNFSEGLAIGQAAATGASAGHLEVCGLAGIDWRWPHVPGNRDRHYLPIGAGLYPVSGAGCGCDYLCRRRTPGCRQTF